MTDNQTNNNNSNEIDLGQLFHMISKGFQRFCFFLLKGFLYLKKNALKIGVLAILGFAVGFGIGKLKTNRFKAQVIVQPYLESKDYLYDVVKEIQSNLKVMDTVFFESLGLHKKGLIGFGIDVEPMSKDKESKGVNFEQQLKYLQLLKDVVNEDNFARGILREEITERTPTSYRITFKYLDKEVGYENAKKLMEYMNSNEYFKELLKISRDNSEIRIKRNEHLIDQIDLLVNNYSVRMLENKTREANNKVVLDTEEQLDMTGLLQLKFTLIKDIENRKYVNLNNGKVLKTINFGSTQQIQESFYKKPFFTFPILFILIYFAFSFLVHLNKKAKEIE